MTGPTTSNSDDTEPGDVRHRNTRQRGAVGALLGELDGFRSAQELHAILRERGERVGLTTVYRTLQALASAGDIDVMRPPDGEQLFRRCSRGHHHHLVCRSCGAKFVPPAELDLALLLRQEGLPKDEVPRRLASMPQADKDLLWGRVRRSRG